MVTMGGFIWKMGLRSTTVGSYWEVLDSNGQLKIAGSAIDQNSRNHNHGNHVEGMSARECNRLRRS